MVLAVVMPLCALIVPMLGLSTTQSALLAGVLLAGGPEDALHPRGLVAGQGHVPLLRPPGHDRAAPRGDRPTRIEARYYTGLVVILLSWLGLYLRVLSDAHAGSDTRIYVLAAMDWRSSSASFSWAGFSEKVRRIFVYEGGFEVGAGSLPSRNTRASVPVPTFVSLCTRARTNIGTKATLATI